MSVQINMTNYEAFYLDYLEGNLSGEALAAFEAFLLEHPELAVDEELVAPIVPFADETFDPVSKLALKKGIDMNDLQPSTLDFFLAARQEKLLSSEQEAQLNHWLEANAHYRQDAQLMALVKLEAAASEVYTNKSGLKRREARIVPMWFTGVAVAAGLALIITLSMNGNGSNNPAGGTPVAHQDTTHNGKQPSHGNQPIAPRTDNGTDGTTNNNTSQPNGNNTFHKNGPAQRVLPQQTPGDQYAQQLPSKQQLEEDARERAELAALDKRDLYLRPTPKNLRPLQIDPVTTPDNGTTVKPATANDLAWTSVDEMKNPIAPLTSKLSSTLNTAVDFRTAKATKKKSGGFFIKIGKLEISHQSASL